MEAKPWETPTFLKSDETSGLPANLDGLTVFVESIKRVEEWRQQRWKQQFPGSESEIEAEVRARIKRLDLILQEVSAFRQCVQDDPCREAQEKTFFNAILIGMAINSASLSWALNAAEKGVARESGQINSKEAKRRIFNARVAMARSIFEIVSAEPKFANDDRNKGARERETAKRMTAELQLMTSHDRKLKNLGDDTNVSVSALRNYLKGERR